MEERLCNGISENKLKKGNASVHMKVIFISLDKIPG